jgi:hypothetical protein
VSLTPPRLALAVLALIAAFGVAYVAGSAASDDGGSSDDASGVEPFEPAASAPKVEGLSDSGSVPAMVPAPAAEASEPSTATPAEPAPAAPAPTPAPAPAPSGGGGGGGGGGTIIEG